MTLSSFPLQVQLVLGIIFSLPLIFTSSNVKCEVFDSNVPNSPKKNQNQYADHLVNQIVKQRRRKRVRILFSSFLSGLLLLLTSASEVKAKRLIPGFVFFPFKSEHVSKTRSRTTMSAEQRNLNGNNNHNINNNKKNAVSIWHEKERLYKEFVEETNSCSLCNNRKECESIIQDYEANQMLSEWKDLRGAQDEAIQLGDDNDNDNNVDEVEKRQEGKVKAETIWVPLLNVKYIKPGDLLPIDLDLDDLGIELESETAIDVVRTFKKHLLLAVGDSPFVEEELSVIDNVSPILMLPTNIYDMTNQYQKLKTEKEDTEEDDGNKMDFACGMKEGRGKFRQKRSNLKAKGGKYSEHPSGKKNTQMKKNLNFKEEKYLDVDEQQNNSKERNENKSFIDTEGKNSLLPLFPSLYFGPFINRVTSILDFNTRIKNCKDNDFLSKINFYNIRINDKNILEICLGKGKYRY